MSKQDRPTCSHCGTEIEEDELWSDQDISKGDGDSSKLICKNLDCGKVFYVQCTHELFFYMVDEDLEEIS